MCIMADNTIKTIIQVRRGTTDEWETHKDYVPKAGEPCMDITKGAIRWGDGVTTYENLKVSGQAISHYEGIKADGESDTAVITRVLTAAGVVAEKGDTFTVKTLISEGKYSYTGFVYDGENWAAMDGNYNASNVYFDKDFVFTEAFGRFKPDSSGSVTVPGVGKNVYEFIDNGFSKESNPITTQPSCSVTLAQAKSYEVGTKVTPSYTTSFNGGKYSYDKTTGVTVTGWKVTDTAGVAKTTATGSFAELTVADNTNYKLTAVATYGDGNIPKTNKGNDYAAGQIKAGSKTATSAAITGYRSFFYGVVSTDSATTPLTSTIVRGLTNGGAYNASKTFTISANASAKRIVIAIPSASITASRKGLSSVLLTSAMDTPVTNSYVKTVDAVEVEGVGGATAVKYTVYVYEPASIDAGEVHKVTLA